MFAEVVAEALVVGALALVDAIARDRGRADAALQRQRAVDAGVGSGDARDPCSPAPWTPKACWTGSSAASSGSPTRPRPTPTQPILLAVSDNGPQMTSGPTREFMALHAIATHFGRPDRPGPGRELLRPPQARMAPPRPDHRRR